jgi:autotransporter translocation and assembly factor TamB
MNKLILSILHLVLQAIVLVSIVLALVVMWFQSPPGRDYVLAQALSLANDAQDDIVISAEGLGAGWPFILSFDKISLADKTGPFLAAQNLSVVWSPWWVLRNQLHVAALKADDINLLRLPEFAPATEQIAGTAVQPGAPFHIDVKKIDVPKIALPWLAEPIAVQAQLQGVPERLDITINRLAIPAYGVTASGQVQVAGDKQNVALAVDLSDLDKLATAFGQRGVTGSAKGTVLLKDDVLQVRLSAPQLDYQAQQARDIDLVASLPMVQAEGRVVGYINLGLRHQDKPITLETDIAVQGDMVRLSNLKTTSPYGGAVGQASYDMAAVKAEAVLDVDLPDLAITSQGAVTGNAKGQLKASYMTTTGAMIEVPALSGTVNELPLQLTKPLVATWLPERSEMRQLSLIYGQTEVTAAGVMIGQTIKATASWNNLHIEQAPPWLGPVTGTIALEGSLQNPQIKALVSINPTIPAPGNVTANIAYANGTADITSTYTQRGRKLFSAETQLGVTLDLLNIAALDPAKITVQGSAQGSLPLDWLAQQDWVDIPVKSGQLDVVAKIVGTASAPEVTGKAALKNASYSLPASGTELRNINAMADITRERITLDSLSAEDGSGGKLSATGVLDMMSMSIDMSIKSDGFRALRHTNADAQLAIDLALKGAVPDAMALSGLVTVQKASITVPEGGGTSLIQLPVKHEGGAPRQVVLAQANASVTSPITLALDLKVKVPGPIRLDGRGVQAELGNSELQIGGTTLSPLVTGSINLIRGRYDFLGKRLTLSKGKVVFDGATLADPALDLQAQHQATGLVATVAVQGRVSKPEIKLSSDPALPQDEIISRILFGQSVMSLTPLQAAQLARAVAGLAMGDGGFDPVADVRRTLGLDQLDVSSTTDASGVSNSHLEVGKYIGDDIYVSSKSGLGTQSQSVGVELKLSPSLSLHSETSQQSPANMQLRYQRDY